MGGIGQAVGGLTNGIIGGQAAVTAGNDETGAYTQGMGMLQSTYNANSPKFNPWIQGGTQAENTLASDTGPNGSLGRQFTATDFHQSPGYQFDLQQGLDAINNSQSVRGGALSGGAQKAMGNYAEQQANNGFQQAYNNFTQNQNQNFGQLSALSGQGLQAVGGLGQLGSNYATGMNQNIVNQGMASAQEALGKAGAFEGGVNSLMQGVAGQQTGYPNSGLSQMVGLFNS